MSGSRLISFAALLSIFGTASATENVVHKPSVKKSLKGVKSVSRAKGSRGGTKPQRRSEVRMDIHGESSDGVSNAQGLLIQW